MFLSGKKQNMYKIVLLLSLFCGFFLITEGKSLVYKNNDLLFETQTENRTITDDTLRQVFNKLKSYIGHDEGFKTQHIFTNTSQMYLNATFNDVHITDPSNYTIPVSHVDMTTLNFDVEIEYPELKAKGSYDLEAENDLFHLVGNGPFSMNVTDLRITISWKFNLTAEKTLEMQSFDLNYIIKDIKVNITNIGGDEEVSQTLNDLINIALPTAINVIKGDVEMFVNKIIQHYSLFILTGMTVDDFVTHVYQFLDL